MSFLLDGDPLRFRASELSWKNEAWGLSALLLLSRALFYLAGVRFDLQPLSSFWQLIDPALLRTDLARSLWNLHAQPPLFNALVGSVLQLAGEAVGPVFHLLFLLCSWGMGLAMLALMRRLGAPPRLRWSATGLFLVGPGAVLYENHLFYTLPVAALLAGSALFLHCWAREGRLRDAFSFWSLAAAVVLSRSVFHPLWFLLLFAGLCFLRRGEQRLLVKAAALPALILLFWFGRGTVLFAEAGGSSWLGMSLAKMLTMRLSDQDLAAFAAGPPPAPILGIRPFRELPAYAALVPQPELTGVPVLDQPFKSTGAPNFHHLAYLDLSRQYLGAVAERVRSRPTIYARAVAFAFGFYFAPAHDSHLLAENRRKIRLWDRGTCLLLGQWRLLDWQNGKPRFAWFLLLGLPLVTGEGLLRLARARRAGELASADALTLAYLLFTILWVTWVGNGLELGENYRFRFEIDPFFVILTVMAVCPLLKRLGSTQSP